MTKTIIKFALLLLVLVLVQVVVFNHLIILGVALPIVFIYGILRLPVNLNINWVMTIAFVTGLAVDVFSDTRGLNAMSCTVFAVLRMPVLRLYFPREEDLTNPEPSVRSLGPYIYMKYLSTLVLIYCTLYFFIESLSFFSPLKLMMCIIGSSIASFIIILAIDSLTSKHSEKRL